MKILAFMALFFLSFTASVRAQKPVWQVEDPSGNHVILSDSPRAIRLIVFYGAFACQECYDKLNMALDDILYKVQNARVVILIRSNPSMRRLLLHDARIDFPKCESFYFDISNPDSLDRSPTRTVRDGLWGAFHVTYCP
ncbi:MAG: hypothetical protein ACRDF4_00960, partial [Rhabdochlamydiaceae bacterium]